MEQIDGHRTQREQMNAVCAGSMADQRYVRRIAAELADVLLDVVEGGNEVHQTVVASQNAVCDAR